MAWWRRRTLGSAGIGRQQPGLAERGPGPLGAPLPRDQVIAGRGQRTEEYSSNWATVFHAALTGFTVSLPYIMATSFRLVFRPAFSR